VLRDAAPTGRSRRPTRTRRVVRGGKDRGEVGGAARHDEAAVHPLRMLDLYVCWMYSSGMSRRFDPAVRAHQLKAIWLVSAGAHHPGQPSGSTVCAYGQGLSTQPSQRGGQHVPSTNRYQAAVAQRVQLKIVAVSSKR